MQPLPGFRDFLPAACAERNYIFATWREIARRYGFVEWDGPVLEPTELYQKKSGPEIVGQLFHFIDKGERAVALRPELTPTLARVVAAHDREFKKPLKWFALPQCFRYEKQQRGRLREHFQLNCDLIGDACEEADAELLALLIDLLRGFGLTHEHFRVYVSHRGAWNDYLSDRGVVLDASAFQAFMTIVDKLDAFTPEVADERLRAVGASLELVQQFISLPEQYFDGFKSLAEKMKQRGLGKYVTIRPAIVRGLAYYTGFVFEAFDLKGKFRAIAGGGRYDTLIEQLSDGAVSLPALGFAMGDVVLGEMIRDNSNARAQMEKAIAGEHAVEIYVVVAKEERRGDALATVQLLREAGVSVDYPLVPTKIQKQFQAAGHLGARVAILFGDEWPQLAVKDLAAGEQRLVSQANLLSHLTEAGFVTRQ